MDLVHLIIVLIFVGIALYLIGLIPMDGTILRIIQVLVIVCVLLYVLQYFIPFGHSFRLGR